MRTALEATDRQEALLQALLSLEGFGIRIGSAFDCPGSG